MHTTRFTARNRARIALLASLAAVLCPAAAHADAGSDLRNDPSLRLWLDSLDTAGSDVDGSVGRTHPSHGQVVATWRDKSIYGHHATGSAATWHYNRGVRFAAGSARYSLPASIYGNTPSNTMEVFVFARPDDPIPTMSYDAPLIEMTNANYWLRIHAGNASTGQVRNALRHQDPATRSSSTIGYVSTTYSSAASNNVTVSEPYIGSLVNLRANGTASQMIVRQEGTTTATVTSSVPLYSNSPTGVARLGGSLSGTGYYGLVGTIMIFDRILNSAERMILTEYLSLWNRYDGVNQDEVYSVTGRFVRTLYLNTYYPYKFFRDYLGGIGREADGSVTTGTSAGLTITDVSFLSPGAYLMAAVDTSTTSNKKPYTGTIASSAYFVESGGFFPAGYTLGSRRRWYIDRTGGTAGNVKMKFDLNAMGLTAQTGQTLVVMHTVPAIGGNTYSVKSTAVYDGSGSVEFTVSNPQDGFYMLAFGAAPPPAPNIVASLTSTSQSDGFSSSNFFNLPGSVLRQVATVSNKGTGSPDANTVSADFAIPPNAKLRLADLGVAGSGPVLFAQGTPTSGLSYTFSGLASTTDSLSFSRDNGATYTYTPVADADFADANVTHFRVTPPGTFATSAAAPYPSFTVTYDLKIK